MKDSVSTAVFLNQLKDFVKENDSNPVVQLLTSNFKSNDNYIIQSKDEKAVSTNGAGVRRLGKG